MNESLFRTYRSDRSNWPRLRKRDFKQNAGKRSNVIERIHKIKKNFDELAEDERLIDPNLYFIIVVFYGTLDIKQTLDLTIYHM